MSNINDADKNFAETWLDEPYAQSEEVAELASAARYHRDESVAEERTRIVKALRLWIANPESSESLERLITRIEKGL